MNASATTELEPAAGPASSSFSSPQPAPWLSGPTLALWTVVAAFGAYFCMYGFRKPYAAADFKQLEAWGLDYKSVAVITQTFGYMLSKFIGIKVIAEATPERRATGILVLVGVAHAALLLLAVTPAPWNIAWLFLNGLMLGMVFGLVLGFLEGRRATEALAAGLCASFIIADGATKAVGKFLLDAGLSPTTMPFVAGLVFLVPLVGFVWMLRQIPPPTPADVAARSARRPMTGTDRWTFFWRFAPGLTAITVCYFLISLLRSIRGDFQLEIWQGLGLEAAPADFGWSEFYVALVVTLATGLPFLIPDNRRALAASIATATAGTILIVASLLLGTFGLLSPFLFMVLLGTGLYLPYVAVHTTVFERIVALTRERANVGYLMYLVDAVGYLGVVGVVLAKQGLGVKTGIVDFFFVLAWIVGLGSLASLVVAGRYFTARFRDVEPNPAVAS